MGVRWAHYKTFYEKVLAALLFLVFFVKVNRYVKKNIKVENLFAYSIKNI